MYRRIIRTTDKPPPPFGETYDANGWNQHLGYGRINVYQALGGVCTSTYYSASVYLYNSRTVLSAPSGTNTVARHRFADSTGGTVSFSVQEGNPYGAVVTTAEVKIANPDSSTTTQSLTPTPVSSTLTTYTVTVPVPPSLTFSVGAASYVPTIVLTHTHGGTTMIPVPVFVLPAPVPASVVVSVSPPTVDAGDSALLDVEVQDAGGNPIVNVPVLGGLVSVPGPGASFTPLAGLTGAYTPVLALSTTPGRHLLAFSVSADGYEDLQASLTVTGLPKVFVHKAVSPSGPVCAGQVLTYTLSWSKGGASTVYDVTLTDTLPNGSAYVGGSLGFWAEDDATGTPGMSASAYAASSSGPWTPGEPPDASGVPLVLRWVVDRLGPGSSGMLMYQVQVSSTLSAAATLGNRASATLAGGSTIYPTEVVASTVAVPGALAGSLCNSVKVSVGQWFPVSITVTNTGGTAVTALAPEIVPAGAGSATQKTSPSGPSVLAPGASATYAWTYSAAGSGLVAFTATVTGLVCGGTSVQSAGTGAVTVQVPAALAGSGITVAPVPVCTGRTFQAVLTVTNTGEADAAGVQGSLFYAGTAGGVTPVSSPAVISFLAGGASANLTWTYQAVTAPNPFSFTATVAGADANSGEWLGTGWLASGGAWTINGGVLSVAGAVAPTRSVGEWFTVSFTVTNTGGDDVDTVTPSLIVSPGGGLVDPKGGPVPTSVANLSPGASQTFVWTFSASGSGPARFQATFAGTSCGGFAVSGSAAPMTTLQTPAHLAGTLAIGPPLREVGQAFSVTLVATNTGEAAATIVQPTPILINGAGGAVVLSCVAPGGWWSELAEGESRTLTCTLSATGLGDVGVSLTVTGFDSNTLVALAALVVSAERVTVVPPGALGLAVTAVTAGPLAVFVGDEITVTVRVKNTGSVVLTGVAPSAVSVQGGGKAEPAGGGVPAGVTLGPGESASFTLTYRATGPGTVRFQAGASGGEGSVVAAPVESNAVVIRESPAGVVVWPSPYRRSTAVRGTLKFCCLTPGDRVTLYTVRGLEVWHADATGRQVEWDGRNAAGRRVVPGTYQWVVEGSGNRRRGTVVVE